MTAMSNALSLLPIEIGTLLLRRRWMMATAESCTAGGIAYAITQVPGSSAWFDRGFVCYSNDAKHELLDVPEDMLERHGAVSEPVAGALARGALAASHAHIAVSVTGIAGPGGGSPGKPVGTVCFGWALQAGAQAEPVVVVSTRQFDGDRAAVRTQSIVAALEGALAQLRALEP
jgi:nicotinamide-nucleotide amidase